MSFYESQGWQASDRQTSWEQPAPPSRSGASSSSQREDGAAFAVQFEEVDRAIDNLVKSGKFYSPGPGPRRESMSQSGMMGPGRQYMDHGPPGPRMHGHGPRHSVSEFHPSPSYPAANPQNFYAQQRYPRQPEFENTFQAKRRLAQQREKELRNYHQEQQYNRSVLAEMASNKSDRSMSPSTLSEEGRRELIARQHRALYGSEHGGFMPSGALDEAGNMKSPIDSGPRGPSPRATGPFGATGQGPPGMEGSGQHPSKAPQVAPGFGAFDASGPPSGAAPTPTAGDDSSHTRHLSKSTTAPLQGGMGPIGSRPNTQHAANPSLNKRTTSPLPSSMSYGFGSSEQVNERSTSSNSNSNAQKESGGNSAIGPWGTGSGVWGSNKIGQTSVWG